MVALCKPLTEAGDSCTQDWSRLDWVEVFRDSNDSLSAQSNVLRITPVPGDACYAKSVLMQKTLSMPQPELTINILLLAGNEIADTAAMAVVAVAAVPASSDALTELPHLFTLGDGDDVSDDLVARDARVLHGYHAVRDLFITSGTVSSPNFQPRRRIEVRWTR